MHWPARFARVHFKLSRLSLLVALLLLPQFALADGSQSYTTPGTYTFTVPAYETLTVTVNGAGGGGGTGALGTVSAEQGVSGLSGGSGSVGGDSNFNDSIFGYGGGGGGGGYGAEHYPVGGQSGPSGILGSASGGDSNTSGAGSSGGTGGAGGWGNGGAGGAGGEAIKTYSTGALTPNSGVSIAVGGGGAGSTLGSTFPLSRTFTGGSPGQDGSIYITWTAPIIPTCTVTLSPNPSPYAYNGTPVTLSWSSSNADDVYINNVGWVNPSGSTQLASQQTIDYSCYGYSAAYGNGAWDTTDTTLTVTPPAIPTVTVSASSTSIYTNQGTNVTADFIAGSGDLLTADNIDEPYGTGIGATTNSDASKTISFSTTIPGTYTFYAMATTDAYPSWASYASTTVTVAAAPSCTPAYTCSGQTIEYTNSFCQESSVAACVLPAFCSAGSDSCLYPAVTFSSSGSYSGNLQLVPNLLQSGESTQVHWSVSDAQSCAVTGTNGDAWSGLSSPTNGETSKRITAQTTYTLSCIAYDSNPNVTESETVNVTPVFKEL